MKRFQKKRKTNNWLYSKLTILVLAFFVFVLSQGSVEVYEKARESLDRKNESIAALQKLEVRKEHLESEVYRLNSDVGVEEELRKRFSLSKEGEKVIVIVDEGNEAENATNSDNIVTKEDDFLANMANLIKRIILVE